MSAPASRAELTPRWGLIERLTSATTMRVVTVVAPAGYGKTTLLRQWTESGSRPVAWVSLEPSDNDPVILLAYVVEALNSSEQLSGPVLAGPLADPVFLHAVALPRLAAALRQRQRPFVLVLDDTHLLHTEEAWALLLGISSSIPDGSQIVLAGRSEPRLPMGRWLAQRQLFRLGPADLAFSVSEGRQLLESTGIELDEDR